LADLKHGLMAFQARYQRAAKPFKWAFTRRDGDLQVLLTKLRSYRTSIPAWKPQNTSPQLRVRVISGKDVQARRWPVGRLTPIRGYVRRVDLFKEHAGAASL
jgi:hypothetical protein